MGSSSLPNDFEIAPGYRVSSWKKLPLENSGQQSDAFLEAVKILGARIQSRFLDPAQCLIDSGAKQNGTTYGFAILALDFLLIETIQGFKNGTLHHRGNSGKLFTDFLIDWVDFIKCLPANSDPGALASLVFDQGRCALHHTGSTDRIKVRKSGPMFLFHPDGRIDINRSLLHTNLSKAFDAYLLDLSAPHSLDLRKNLKRKMDHICGV